MHKLILASLMVLISTATLLAQMTVAGDVHITTTADNNIQLVGKTFTLEETATLHHGGAILSGEDVTLNGTLTTTVSGLDASIDYGTILSEGTVRPSGTLIVTQSGTYTPEEDARHELIQSNLVEGTFMNVDLPAAAWRVEYGTDEVALIFDELVSNEAISSQSFQPRVYPNPTRDLVRFKAPYNSRAALMVYDNMGRKLLQLQPGIEIENGLVVDLPQGTPAGVYRLVYGATTLAFEVIE